MAKKNETNVGQMDLAPEQEPTQEQETVQNQPSLKIEEENQKLTQENKTLKSEITDLRKILEEQANPVYLVVFPYKKSEAQGQELRHALTGWMKHFKEHFRMVVVGDQEEYFAEMSEDITYIPHECTFSNSQLDVVSKLMTVMSELPEYENLILTNDDIYPVNDFDIIDVKFLKADGLLSEVKTTGKNYGDLRLKTLELLKNEQRSVFDFDCHTPVCLQTSRLLKLVEHFNLVNEPALLVSLYFNYFFPGRVPMKLELSCDNLKAGVYRRNADLRKLRELFPRKIWINNSEEGWSPEFAALLKEIL